MEIVFAGFGGQGVLTSGLIVAYAAMKGGYRTLWSSTYGAANARR
ncbi:MAG: 2-oxoacid:acceptor oxidoreductase family protein [bacterium]